MSCRFQIKEETSTLQRDRCYNKINRDSEFKMVEAEALFRFYKNMQHKGVSPQKVKKEIEGNKINELFIKSGKNKTKKKNKRIRRRISENRELEEEKEKLIEITAEKLEYLIETMEFKREYFEIIKRGVGIDLILGNTMWCSKENKIFSAN